MGDRLDRLREMLKPPVTAEWVDRVVTEGSRKADEIEASRGPEAADRYREKTGREVKKMLDRGVI